MRRTRRERAWRAWAFRMSLQDRELLFRAARRLGISQGEFLRNALRQTAAQVLAVDAPSEPSARVS
jgi:hypothetical protein